MGIGLGKARHTPSANKAIFLIFALFLMNGMAYAICPGTITEDYNMTSSESSTSTCFVIGTENVTLDCKGYSVTLTGGGNVPAVDLNARNITIKNCNIVENSGTNRYMGALYLRSSANNTLIVDTNVSSVGHYSLYVASGYNNFTNVRASTTTSNRYTAYFESSSYNTLTNMVINKTTTASTYSVYWNGGENNTFRNVTVGTRIGGSTRIYGAYLSGFSYGNIQDSFFQGSYTYSSLLFVGGSVGNTVNNSVVRGSTSTSCSGIYLDVSSSNSIYNSDISVAGVGIYVVSSSGSTHLENLTVTSTGSSGIYINPGTPSHSNIINNVSVVAPGYALFFSPSSYNTIENSTFNSTTNYAFYSDTGTDNNRFFNNSFVSRPSGGYSHCMYFAQSSSNNIILNNTINSPTYYGIYFAESASNYNVIQNNTIIASGNYGSHYGYGIVFGTTPSNYNNITGNYIRAVRTGLQIYGDYNKVDYNIISVDQYGYGIYLASSGQGTVIGNEINSTYYYPFYGYYAENNLIANNSINCNGTHGSYSIGMYLYLSSSNTIENNTVITSGSDALRITSSASENVFRNNSFRTNATNYYGVQVSTNCQNNKFYDNNFTSERGYGLYIVSNSKHNVFTGGYVDAYTQRGMTVISASYNNFSNMSVRTGINNPGSQALYLDSASSNHFENVSFLSNASYAAYFYSGVYDNDFSNVSFYSNYSYGIYMRTSTYANTFRNFSIRANNTYALYMYGIAPVYDNAFYDGVIESNYSGGYAVYLYLANYNNFTNVNITNTKYRALRLLTSTNNMFNGVRINAGNVANAIGVLAQTLATENVIANSTINASAFSGAYDVYIGNSAVQPSSLTLLNSSYNNDFYFGDVNSYINISWYLRVNLTDLAGTTGIEGATINFTDSYSTQVASETTDENGLTSFVEVQEYQWKSTGSGTPFRPYDLNASVGSVTASKQSNPTSVGPETENMNINATTCKALAEDYVLTNNVYGFSNCFTASANDITLDCAGYSVNYSRASSGCGFNASGFTGITMKGCGFAQGNYNSSSSGAVCLSSNAQIIAANSSISSLGGSDGYDFVVSSSNATAVNVSTSVSNANITGNGTLLRTWYTSFNLTDLSGNQILYSNLNITNRLNETVSSLLLDTGFVSMQELSEYLQNSSGPTYYSNYTLFAWTGVANNTTYLNLTTNTDVVIEMNASTCRAFTSSMTLKNNLYSDATCLVAGADGLSLDCAGYYVNYSRAGDGYYGIDTASYDNLILRNCHFVMGNTGANYSYAVLNNNSSAFTLANSTITGNAAYINLTTNAQFINTSFENSTVSFGEAQSNLTAKQYALIHAIGLAGEDVNGSEVNATDVYGTVVQSGTTDGNGTLTMLVSQFVQNQSGLVAYDPYNFTAIHPETSNLNFTYTPMNESKNVTIGLISAVIEVISPNESQVFIQGDPVEGGPVNILVNETLGQDWIVNVTAWVTNDIYNQTYQAYETYNGSNLWEYNYSIGLSQPAATITIVARGYNGDAYVQATRNFVVTRSSGAGVADPIITYFCPDYTYVAANQTTNITVAADLDTVLHNITLTVTYPNNTSIILQENSSSSGSNYTYNKTWAIETNQTGTHILFAQAVDVNSNIVNSTKHMYVVPSNETINLTLSGIDTLQLNDVCSGITIASGTELNGISVAPGNYSIIGEDTNRTLLTFNQFNVTSFNGTFATYSEESATSLVPPENRRNIFLLQGQVNGGSFGSIGMRINYTEDEGTLVAENSLDMYRCNSFVSCTWEALNYTLNTTSNLINTTIANMSGLYGVFEPAYPTPEVQTITQYQSSTQYVDVEVPVNVTVTEVVEVPTEVPVEVPTYTAIRLIDDPGLIELYPRETIGVEISLTNSMGIDLGTVTLGVVSDSGIDASLSQTSFEMPAGSSHDATLVVTSREKSGNFKLTLTAKSASADIKDELIVPVIVSEDLEKDKLSAKEKINFAKQLLDDNPECLDLEEMLTSASLYLENGNYIEASDNAQKAISGCSGIMALRGKPVVQKEVVPQVDWAVSLVVPIAFAGATAAVALITYMFMRRFGGRKKSPEGQQGRL